MKKNKLKLTYLLRPHWATLGLALVAVLIESATDLLDPWPLKIVFDYVIGSKQMPHRLAAAGSSHFGQEKLAGFKFGAAAVVIISAVGAGRSFAPEDLTTKVG